MATPNHTVNCACIVWWEKAKKHGLRFGPWTQRF